MCYVISAKEYKKEKEEETEEGKRKWKEHRDYLLPIFSAPPRAINDVELFALGFSRFRISSFSVSRFSRSRSLIFKMPYYYRQNLLHMYHFSSINKLPISRDPHGMPDIREVHAHAFRHCTMHPQVSRASGWWVDWRGPFEKLNPCESMNPSTEFA